MQFCQHGAGFGGVYASIYLIAQKVTQNIETPTLLLADQTGHDVSLTPAHRKTIQDAGLMIWLGKAHGSTSRTCITSKS